MSRRFFIPLVPLEHINGKIANCKVKCPNTDDPEHTNDGFMYGYRHGYNPHKSCFGIRIYSRNLLTNPYTAAEQENRDLFSISLLEVQIHWQDPGDRAKCIADFDKQDYYHTPRGFAVAMTRENGGQWPGEWTQAADNQ